ERRAGCESGEQHRAPSRPVAPGHRGEGQRGVRRAYDTPGGDVRGVAGGFRQQRAIAVGKLPGRAYLQRRVRALPRLNSRLGNLTRALRQGAGQAVPKVPFGSPADVVKFLEDVLHEVRTGRMDARIGHCLATIADKALKAFELAELERLK